MGNLRYERMSTVIQFRSTFPGASYNPPLGVPSLKVDLEGSVHLHPHSYLPT